MKKKRFTEAQRSMILSEQGTGKTAEEICRAYQISPATFYHWKQEAAIHNDEDRMTCLSLFGDIDFTLRGYFIKDSHFSFEKNSYEEKNFKL